MERNGERSVRLARHIPAFLLCVVVVVYCAYHLISALIPKPVIQPACLTDFAETVVLSGTIFRAETVLYAPTAGTVVPLKGDGEKIAVGQEVAKIYATLNEQAYDQLTEVRRRLSILERAKTTYTSLKNAPGVRALIEETVLQYNEAVARNDMAAAMALRDRILAARAQYQALVSGYSSYADVVAALSLEASALEAKLGTATASVIAPDGGCYYRYTDGYERICHAAAVESLTVSGFRTLQTSSAESYGGLVAGKLVSDYTWYAVAETDSATAAAFTAGGTYTLRFLSADATVEMTLYRTVTSHTEDAVLLIFSCNRVSDALSETRTHRIEVTVSAGKGYAVPAEAVRSVDGRTGVYVLDRYVVRFREISIIGEQNGTYYCDPAFEGEGRLRLYDSVIVSGKDLYDGKVLN